jgi:hypothetical protein
MIEPRELEAILRNAFPDASVLTLEDLTGTKDHYQLTLVSSAFEGCPGSRSIRLCTARSGADEGARACAGADHGRASTYKGKQL